MKAPSNDVRKDPTEDKAMMHNLLTNCPAFCLIFHNIEQVLKENLNMQSG